MCPRASISDGACMTRLPAAGGTAGHSGVVAAVAEVAFCGVCGDGFEVHADLLRGGGGGGGCLWRGSEVVVVSIFRFIGRYRLWVWQGI